MTADPCSAWLHEPRAWVSLVRDHTKILEQGREDRFFLHSAIGKGGMCPQSLWQRLPWVCNMQIKEMIAIILSPSPLANSLKQ